MAVARNLDLVVLVLALPVFLALGAPIAGYLVAGGAWLAGRFADQLASRRRRSALEAGNRNAALGVTAASMLGRLWILAGAILVVGLIEREAGLAAAILAFALVTAHLSAAFVAHLFDPEGDR